MSETLIPTARLRFIEKPEPVDGTGMVSTTRKIRVLQQQFYQPSGRVVWIDVPLEAPEAAADQQERTASGLTLMNPAECEKADSEHGPFVPAHQAYALRDENELLLGLLWEWFDVSDPNMDDSPGSLLERTRAAFAGTLQARLTEAERVISEARANVGQLSSGCFREQWAADRGAAAWVVLDNYHETYLR